jgi:hypothetical protein
MVAAKQVMAAAYVLPRKKFFCINIGAGCQKEPCMSIAMD